MGAQGRLYRDSLSLHTDLYELTMAYGYWKVEAAERTAAFHLTCRNHPFGGGYTVACGQAAMADYMESLAFSEDDLEYMTSIESSEGRRMFEPAFLDYLRGMRWRWDVDAVREGTVVFPHEPLVRVTGPLLQCQLLETALLNLVTFPTLIATKAARVCQAAGDGSVLEFGLRRAQGIDGGAAASRAAYVGGCAGSSNVLAGKLFGVPPRGTHAHSWVMAFDSEWDAFEAYAEAMPDNCIFLVDTYDTLAGVRRAIEVGKRLRIRGHEMVGVRLDSGDLAALSRGARRLLDEAGFRDAIIVASGDLDERTIAKLRSEGAAVDAWGVGTRLATGHPDAALNGVYKLTAVRDDDSRWQPRVKRSEELAKSSLPGVLGVRRFADESGFLADAIYELDIGISDGCTIVDVAQPQRRREIPAGNRSEDLLEPLFREGRLVADVPSAKEARDRCREQLAMLPAACRRLDRPEPYPAGLEARLHELATRLLDEARDR